MKPLYFDYNATSPVLDRVREAMLPYLSGGFGNPGSGHAWGLTAKRALDQARASMAGLLACGPERICFTSCATESNNLALWGVFGESLGGHLVVSAVEHPAILQYAAWLETRGVAVTRVGVDGQGVVSPDEVLAACGPDTRLISIMLANNETGAIQPVAEVTKRARERGILVHSDAAQAVGKIPARVNELGVDLLTVAGHKMYAPKGVGALFVREGVSLTPLLRGGGQENGLRAGTENIPYLVGLGEAAALAAEDLEAEMDRQRELGRRFLDGLGRLGVDFRLHSAEAPRLPGTMAVGFKGLRAGDILSGMVTMELGASAGAACHGDTTEVSHVLAAMGVDDQYAHGTIRFSWGRPTSTEDIDELLNRLAEILGPLA